MTRPSRRGQAAAGSHSGDAATQEPSADRQLPHPLSAAAYNTDCDRPTSAQLCRSLKPNSASSKPTALHLARGFTGCQQLFNRRHIQQPNLAHFQAAVPLAPPNRRDLHA